MVSKKKEKQKLLIIEDDPGLQKQLKWSFDNYEVIVANGREEAMEKLRETNPPVVTLDLGLPPDTANATEGLLALEEILAYSPNTKVIVVTGNDEHASALKSISLGAYDFYQKPVEPEILGLIIERAHKLYLLEQEIFRLTKEQKNTPLQGFITSNSDMIDICNTIAKVAPADVSILLLGESGTGKELLARALHDLGLRKEGPFIAINCAAIPENLLESELFGYEKGSFTGAAKQTKGKIEYADGGTLFLDEVGDLPLSLQSKLLRFLQERVIERIGGREEIAVDIRIICATYHDLRAKIHSNEFREDLYYRISEISIDIPPLRERLGDAVLLGNHFLEVYQNQKGNAKKFSKSAKTAIESYTWPGNVRELENKVKRACILAESGTIKPADLDLEDIAPYSETEGPIDLKSIRELAEQKAIRKALVLSSGKITETARLLGISRPTLYNLLERHNINQT